MKRNADHALLDSAKQNKNDEFYTQLSDIERELQYYRDNFHGKSVLCNCDNPRVSNFFRYFVREFRSLGLKKVVATCCGTIGADLFTRFEPGVCCEYTGVGNTYDIRNLKSDGDFRSEECVKFLREADIVVTNPPFSLFREFVSMLVRHDKKFLVIGNINAITYKEIFGLIKSNRAWMGVNMGRGISGFIVPEYYELYGLETKVNERGERIVSPNNCMWLTNLDIAKRHESIPLVRIYHGGNEGEYPHYDNCDAINVDRTQDIPCDYSGLMGVPITFLHKFNPDQFEIVRFRKGDDGKDLTIGGKPTYFRILIRNRKPNAPPKASVFAEITKAVDPAIKAASLAVLAKAIS